MQEIFSGVRVVDFSEGMAGPMATMIMADHGAEVIKVEPPGGDWARQSPGFLMWNRGKKGVVLDPADARDRASATDLALSADVVLHSWKDDAALRFGLDYASLGARRESLVYGSISGFGVAKRYEYIESYEPLVVAKSGRVNGNDQMSGAHFSGRPIYITSAFASFGAAGLTLQGVAASLYSRTRTGLGQKVETSLLDGISAATMRLAFAREGDKVVTGKSKASALIRRGIDLCFLTPECKDGRYIQMCARTDHHFRNWFRAMGLGHLLEEERFAKAPMGFKSEEDIVELEAVVRLSMRAKTAEEWISVFTNEIDVGGDPFLRPEEFLEHPQMLLNDRVIELDDRSRGKVRQLGPLVLMADTPARIRASAPELGEHQQELESLLRNGRTVPPAFMPAVPKPPSGVTIRKSPLEGVTILELAYFLAGPLGATLLAELGARVIKVEPLDGDPFRRLGLEFAHLVHGKESLPVDLKLKEGQEILHRIMGSADALIHSFRPGAPARLGVDYETVSRINPKLVYLYAASYGSNGPEKHRPAFHSTPHALNGGGILQGGRGNPPIDDSYPDPCSGIGAGMALALGLLARERTGRGQYMETTMLTSSGYVHSERLTRWQGMPSLPMLDGEQAGFHALDRLYRTLDGWLMLSVMRESEWKALAVALDRQHWLSDPRFADRHGRLANEALLAGELGGIFATRGAQSLEDELTARGVPVAAVRTSFEEFMVESELATSEEHGNFGTYWRLKPRTRFSTMPNRIGLPSAIGEHTHALLEEFGYSAREIGSFIDRKIVAAA